MYKHLLVPIEDSPLSATLVSEAVRYAAETRAKITFFHAARDYLATEDGALMHAMAPDILPQKIAGEAHSILNKAQAAARAAHVEADGVFKVSNSLSQSIIDTATDRGCDLIYTMTRGPVSVGPLSLGSQTFKLVAHSPIPVLIAAVARNSPTPEMDLAVAIIEDEHRSLAAVLHAARNLLANAAKTGTTPELPLLELMLFYVRKFPEALHHPKEDEYLFECLRKRTSEVDETLALLQRQHADCTLLDELEQALKACRNGVTGSLTSLTSALEAFSKAEFQHMAIEESIILPTARRHLTKEDWAMIAAAFDQNKTPSAESVTEELFKGTFSSIMRQASPATRLALATSV